MELRAGLLRWRSERPLVRRAVRGDRRAFDVLLSRYDARLLVFCRELLGSRDAADRLLRDAREAAYASLLAGGAPADVRTWLYRILRDACLTAEVCVADAGDPDRTIWLLRALEPLSDRQIARVIDPAIVTSTGLPERKARAAPGASPRARLVAARGAVALGAAAAGALIAIATGSTPGERAWPGGTPRTGQPRGVERARPAAGGAGRAPAFIRRTSGNSPRAGGAVGKDPAPPLSEPTRESAAGAPSSSAGARAERGTAGTTTASGAATPRASAAARFEATSVPPRTPTVRREVKRAPTRSTPTATETPDSAPTPDATTTPTTTTRTATSTTTAR